MNKEPLDPLIEGYLEYMKNVSRRNIRTIIDIRCTLKHATEAMSKLHPDVSLWKLTLNDYIRWIDQERNQGRTSGCLGKYLSHIRGLLNYAWRIGRADRNVLDGFFLQDSQVRNKPTVLSLEEARLLIEGCPSKTFTDRRNRLILLVLYGCGLRTNEICNLNVQDVDRQRVELHIHHAKGDIERVVPIPQAVYTELMAYLLDRGGKRGPLFRTDAKHKRVTSKHICGIVKQASLRSGIAWKVTPRTLRHSYATHLMDRGVDLAVISSLMGHRSPSETGVYLHVLKDKPKKAIENLFNKNGGQKK